MKPFRDQPIARKALTLGLAPTISALLVAILASSIAPGFLPYVFDRFRQADQSTTREHGGLGLGLAIAKEITELHGGMLEAASGGRGNGTRMTITLPRLPAGELPVAPAAIEHPNLSGKRILVVDDDPESLEIATQALSLTRAT